MDESPDIHRRIPHRPPFLFLDEVLEATPEHATARRTLRADEPHFAGHYPGSPIMPGVLLCEATFQLGAVYLSHKLDLTIQEAAEGRTPVLTRIREARFKKIVRPGDVLDLEVRFVETRRTFHTLTGLIRHEDKTVLTNEFVLAII